MSGGLSGKQTVSAQLPSYLNEAVQALVAQAGDNAQIGYTPYHGPSVAAFTPMQQAAFQGANQAAGVFGLPTVKAGAGGGLDGMPAPKTFAGGHQGYSSQPLFAQARQEWAKDAPGQAKQYAKHLVGKGAGK